MLFFYFDFCFKIHSNKEIAIKYYLIQRASKIYELYLVWLNLITTDVIRDKEYKEQSELKHER